MALLLRIGFLRISHKLQGLASRGLSQQTTNPLQVCARQRGSERARLSERVVWLKA